MEKRYQKFSLKQNAELALNYLEKMVDKDLDFLPYWLVVPHGSPAYAKHCRVDDAELVASWYEAVSSVQKILGDGKGEEVKSGFYRHLMKSWGEHGLRFHEKYPWTHTMHASFHEMGYVLSALNRIIAENPEDLTPKTKAKDLVHGMRKLVIERKRRTFWSGDYVEPNKIYEFPNDVYLEDGGFNLECHTGRGEQALRNGVVLHPLVVYFELTGDETALDLACGLANHIIGPSRYFSHKMEFFGHVHSVVWMALGLIRLGNILNDEKYLKKGKQIYDFVISLSSSFVWVPEYAWLHPQEEEFCETCCIKDMIEGAKELINAGFSEYYNIILKYTANMLDENQIKDGSFAPTAENSEDTEEITYTDIASRIVGGYTGGSEPGCISIDRFRSLAGCCAGTGPQALLLAWELAASFENGLLCVDLPIDKTINGIADIITDYPNEGQIIINTHKDMTVNIRLYDFMDNNLTVTVGGEKREVVINDGYILLGKVKGGETVRVEHNLLTHTQKEHVRGVDYTVTWRGYSVVDLSPKANHIRLFQRDNTIKRFYPTPKDIKNPNAEVVATPTQ